MANTRVITTILSGKDLDKLEKLLNHFPEVKVSSFLRELIREKYAELFEGVI